MLAITAKDFWGKIPIYEAKSLLEAKPLFRLFSYSVGITTGVA
jgi:hypothetical protein